MIQSGPQIEDIIARLQRKEHKMSISLNTGASQSEIDRFEQIWGGVLPDDFRKLYRFSNGFIVTDDNLSLVSLEDILYHDEFNKPMEDFFMVEWLMYCDMWSVGVDRVVANNYIVYNYANDMAILTNSLVAFLERVIDFGVVGLFDWREEITGKR